MGGQGDHMVPLSSRKHTSGKGENNMRMSNARFGFLCSVPGLIGLFAFIFYPLMYSTYISLLRYDIIHPIVFRGLRNYGWIFSSSDFYLSWRISTTYSLGSTSLTLSLGLILAHSLHRITRGSTVFRTLSILPWAAPLVISGLMWRWILSKDLGIINYLLRSLGLINENIGFLLHPSLGIISGICASSWCYMPFMTIILLAGLESIPESLYEAAEIDGADQLQKFWYISLPMNKHQILIGCLIILMFTFRTPDIFFSLTEGGPAKFTYHAGLFLFDLIYRYHYFGRAGALSIVLFLTVLGFTLPLLYYGIVKTRKL